MDLWGVLRSKERYKRLGSVIKCADDLARVKIALSFLAGPSADATASHTGKATRGSDCVCRQGTGSGRRPALRRAVVFVFAHLPEAFIN